MENPLDQYKHLIVNHRKTIREGFKRLDSNGEKFIVILDDNNRVLSVVTDGDFRRAIWNSISLEDPIANITNKEFVYFDETLEFDIVLIEGLIPVYKYIIQYADIIKRRNPKAIIIAGGSADMSVPELLLLNSKVDVICAGEGEHIIVFNI